MATAEIWLGIGFGARAALGSGVVAYLFLDLDNLRSFGVITAIVIALIIGVLFVLVPAICLVLSN